MSRSSRLKMFFVSCAFCAVAMSSTAQIFTTFNVPGAGTGAGQGTITWGINTAGTITGYYVDAVGLDHGFGRAASGAMFTFDVAGLPGGGADRDSCLYCVAIPPGTIGGAINTAGVVAGLYVDANDIYHGFALGASSGIAAFDAPGAGTGAGQGTLAYDINTAGTITGYYIDASTVYHGFLYAASGAITTFDVPGAGTGAGQGTVGQGINTAGAITGYYGDANSVWHGFLRTP